MSTPTLIGILGSRTLVKSVIEGDQFGVIISTPPTFDENGEITGSYAFYHDTDEPEDNEPLYAAGIRLGNEVPSIGTPLTTIIDDLVVPNGSPLGTFIYRWYRCVDRQETADYLIVGATAANYTPVQADKGLFLRVEVDLFQATGGNLAGPTYKSPCSVSRVTGGTADIFYDIPWEEVFLPDELPVYDTKRIWANRGSALANYNKHIVLDAADKFPDYSVINNAMSFVSANSDRLNMPSILSGSTYEHWLKIKPTTLNGTIWAASNTFHLQITSLGAIRTNGVNSPNGLIVAGNDYVIRVAVNPNGDVLFQVNNGTIYTVNGGTLISLTGKGFGRLGSTFGRTNFYNGLLSHKLRISRRLTNTEATAMWTKFGY